MRHLSKTDPSESKRTAFHEAGHFVLASLLRPKGGYSEVSTKPIADTLGHVGLGLTPDEVNGDPVATRNLIVVLFAGMAAEVELLDVAVEQTKPGAADDEAMAKFLLDTLGLERAERREDQQQLWDKACQLVVKERVAIEKQAKVLLEKAGETLDGHS